MADAAPREVSRKASNLINDVLDDWVPPRLRDSRPFAWAARRLYRNTTVDINEFKDRAHYLDPAEYAAFYAGLDPRYQQGDTDLTPGSFAAVLESVVGDRVLDVACGDALLTQRLADTVAVVVGVDVFANPVAHQRTRRLAAGDLERLPFADATFDTVVSTHTLEHVQHLPAALDELRRVTRRRLIVVVPKQRPYRVTFNPHIHFFPYAFSVLAFTGTDRPHTLRLVDRDWLYVEEQGEPER